MEAMQKAAVIENNERQPVSSKPEVRTVEFGTN